MVTLTLVARSCEAVRAGKCSAAGQHLQLERKSARHSRATRGPKSKTPCAWSHSGKVRGRGPRGRGNGIRQRAFRVLVWRTEASGKLTPEPPQEAAVMRRPRRAVTAAGPSTFLATASMGLAMA